ncbi:diacylglycerol/lipid kinase family protein [Granulibacter bethesdensis]|uniref:diacylglycerol/lipid kinase family protein n=1 Tax=Granulibacter bethesdensis TaxID=364410 RepID=UPI0003F1ECA0|nr:diacylglycerol kinase family protein [Granulibacter bethesdensis]AHJ67882.1 Diacylglycerol kinase family protein [Granulibacter bethesdensis]
MIVIFNPAAGQRRPGRLWAVLDLLLEHGIKVELAETRHPGHATELARQAAASGTDMIVAAGGDGTIAEIAQGMIGSPTRLGILPLGSANVLAHELTLPVRAKAIASTLAFRRTRPLWPGLVQAGQRQRLFVQMLGVGFDAQVVHHLPLPLKRFTGRIAYAAQSIREISRYRSTRFPVIIDGQPHEAATVIVAKGRYYGGPFLLAPDAASDSPGFSIAMFQQDSTRDILKYGLQLLFGQLPACTGLKFLRGREIIFPGSTILPAQADGDPAGHTPLHIGDAPCPLRVVVP